MCILSLVCVNENDFILTHNRDESIRKKASDSFLENTVHGKKVFYPKDFKSNGTWIYFSDKYVGCVLNGAYDFHMPGGEYRLSRGLLVLDLLKHRSIESFYDKTNFDDVEPFTFVFIDIEKNEKKSIIWDGKKRRLTTIGSKVFVWSSATFYTEEHKCENRNIIKKAFDENPSSENIMHAHENRTIVNHPFSDQIKTLSISQIIYKNRQFSSSIAKLS